MTVTVTVLLERSKTTKATYFVDNIITFTDDIETIFLTRKGVKTTIFLDVHVFVLFDTKRQRVLYLSI